MNKTTILSFGMLFFLTSEMSCSQKEKANEYNFIEQEVLPEEIALQYLLDSLLINNDYLSQNDSLLYKVGLAEELVDLFDVEHRYLNGKICSLSRPFMYSTDSIISQLIKKRVREYESDYLKKKNNLTALSYTLPENSECLKWRDYQELENDSSSLFITLRHHIESQSEYQIEINISSTEYIPNPSEYTFYVFLDKGHKFLGWEVLMKYDFDETIDC